MKDYRLGNKKAMKNELSTSNEQILTIDAVDLANGEYPASPLPLKILAEAPYVVCCDGRADEYIRRGHTPDVIIGDGDSLSDENRRKFGHILHRISDQETNDQTKAVNFLLAQGKRRIAIIGATGKREDHTLGNISLLIDYLRAGADVRTYTDYGIFIPSRGTRTFPSHPGQQVSIINFTAHGLHGKEQGYPLSDFTNWWQGTLNECTGTEFTIEAEVEIPAPHLSAFTPRGRVSTTEREAGARKMDFQCIECGMTLEEAQRASARCLRCDHFGYGVCKGGREEKW